MRKIRGMERHGSWDRKQGGGLKWRLAGFKGKGELGLMAAWGPQRAGGCIRVSPPSSHAVPQSCSLIHGCIIHSERAQLWLCSPVHAAALWLCRVSEQGAPGYSWLSLGKHANPLLSCLFDGQSWDWTRLPVSQSCTPSLLFNPTWQSVLKYLSHRMWG